MILSVLRFWALVLAAVILLGCLVMPVEAAAEGKEITLREDGLLQSSLSSIVAGIGATVCVGTVFVIVWKQWEP